MPERNYEIQNLNYGNSYYENGAHLQKTMQQLPSASAAAQGKGIFFYLLIGIFLIAFMDSGCLESSKERNLQNKKRACYEKVKAFAIVKAITTVVCGK